MADYNSSLPITGSVAIASSSLIGVSGAIFDSGDITGSVVISSSTLLGVSGLIFTGGNLTGSMATKGIGSVVIKSAPLIGVSGAIFDSGDITGSVVVSDAVRLGVSGTVDIGNTISTIEGVHSPTNLVFNFVSGLAIPAGGSDVHTYESTGSFYCSRVLTGFSGKGKVVVAESGTSNIFKAVGFNSTANPNINLDFGESNGLYVYSGSGLSVILYNREASEAQDVYSSVVGYTFSA